MTGALATSARAADSYMELEPPDTLATFGTGYNSLSREFTPQECVTFGQKRLAGAGGGVYSTFHRVFSKRQLASEMGIGVHANFGVSILGIGGSVDNKTSFFEQTQTNFSALTILATWQSHDPTSFISGDIMLKPEFKTLNVSQFREKCDNYLIIGTQSGREFFGTAYMEIGGAATANELASETSGDVDFLIGSASVDVNYLHKMKKVDRNSKLVVYVTASGGKRVSTTVDELISQFKAFPRGREGKRVLRLIAVPYEDIVADWPMKDPRAALGPGDKLLKLADVAWDLTALQEDAEFLLHNERLFAAGTTHEQRAKRFKYLRGRSGWYEAQLAKLRKEARGCEAKFDADCEKLYRTWKDFEPADEYAEFPLRYISDCGAAQLSREYLEGRFHGSEAFKKGRFNPIGPGDMEMSSGPVGVDAKLKFEVDFTGGDRTKARSLMAALGVTLKELHEDYTTFHAMDRLQVFNFDTSSHGNYRQCAFVGDGVKAQANKDGYHGTLSDRTGDLSDATGKTRPLFTRGSWGALTSARCTVDDEGSDAKHVACSDFGFRDVQLALVNKEDLPPTSGPCRRNPRKPASRRSGPGNGTSDRRTSARP